VTLPVEALLAAPVLALVLYAAMLLLGQFRIEVKRMGREVDNLKRESAEWKETALNYQTIAIAGQERTKALLEEVQDLRKLNETMAQQIRDLKTQNEHLLEEVQRLRSSQERKEDR